MLSDYSFIDKSGETVLKGKDFMVPKLQDGLINCGTAVVWGHIRYARGTSQFRSVYGMPTNFQRKPLSLNLLYGEDCLNKSNRRTAGFQ